MENESPTIEVSAQALAAFRENKEAINREVVARSLARTEETAHHGAEAERLITSGIEFTTRMLDSAMAVGEIALLEDQLTWAMERLPHDGVVPRFVLNRLEIYREVVEACLPAPYASEVGRVVGWMTDRQQELVQARNTDV
jgi:hypothetical protein